MTTSHSLRMMLAAGLRARSREVNSIHAADAYELAAQRVEADQPIPTDVREVIDRDMSFTQDRYGK